MVHKAREFFPEGIEALGFYWESDGGLNFLLEAFDKITIGGTRAFGSSMYGFRIDEQ